MLLANPQIPSRYQSPPQHPFNFVVNNCGATIGIKAVSVGLKPDPIVLGQNISITADIAVGQIFDSNLKIGLTLEKKELGVYIEIPCIDNIGSCDYTGAFICEELAKAAAKADVHAILAKYNLPMACPVAPHEFIVPTNDPINVHINDPGLSWLTSGDIYAKAVVTNAAGTQTACIEIYFSIK